jgi:hypothetical protein
MSFVCRKSLFAKLALGGNFVLGGNFPGPRYLHVNNAYFSTNFFKYNYHYTFPKGVAPTATPSAGTINSVSTTDTQ